ncbi:MAG: ROK family protein [Tetrasphaera sp.]
MNARAYVGVDVGGTGIKAALVDVRDGKPLMERLRVPTPQPATPEAIAEAITQVVHRVPGRAETRTVGIALPAVVTDGVVRTAANIDASWIGTDAAHLLADRVGAPVAVLNDGDAAGLAEMAFGAAQGVHGVVVLVTLGTGIGTSLLMDGRLFPNTELGHLVVDGENMCYHAAMVARDREHLTWEQWADRLQRYLRYLEDLIWPDLIVLGGGGSWNWEHFRHLLDIRTEIVPAALANRAGIVGAALAASRSRRVR